MFAIAFGVCGCGGVCWSYQKLICIMDTHTHTLIHIPNISVRSLGGGANQHFWHISAPSRPPEPELELERQRRKDIR